MNIKLLRSGLTAFLVILFVSCTCQRKGVEGGDPHTTFRVNLLPGTALKDPLLNLDQERLKVLSLVFESLLRYSPSGELAPVLLSELPTLSADQLTYSFKLKEATFHKSPSLAEGKKVGSKDVVMSLLRGLVVKDTSTYAQLLTGLIEGAAQWSQSSKQGDWFGKELPSGFKIISDSEFSIKLLRKYPDFLSLLTLPAFSVLPWELLGAEQIKEAIGSGPYAFTNPKVDSAEWDLKSISSHKYTSIQVTDKLEAAAVKESDYSALNLKLASEVIEASTGALKDMPEHSLRPLRLRRLELLVLNLKDPTLKSLGIGFRRSLLSALNPEFLLQQMYKGMGEATLQFIPSGVEGALSNGGIVLEDQEKSLAKVKKALGKKSLKVTYPESTQYWVQYLEKTLEPIKENFVFEAVDNSSYLEKIEKGDFQIAPLSWEGDLPEATNYLQLYFSGSQKNEQNLSGFKSNAFDKAFDKLSKLFPSPERRKLAEEAHRIVLSELPSLPLGYKKEFVVLSKRAQNIKIDALDSNALKDFLVEAK